MIFPTLALWSSSDPEDPLGRIDRALNDRNHRLSAGLSISERFDQVQGALVVSQGNGRYIRIRHVVGAAAAIPKSIRDGCREFVDGSVGDLGQLAPLLAGLAETQANVVEQLKCEAGKYVDRVLAVGICDPGLWTRDFDGKISYAPMCDAARLAELCGVTVIDAFPARDLVVGGGGQRLEALPYWILFGDRDPKIASQSRGLISIGEQCHGYRLPASDGLDAEIPTIQMFDSPGIGFLDELIQNCLPPNQRTTDLDRLYADGKLVAGLRKRWESVVESVQIDESDSAAGNLKATQQMVREAQAYLDGNSNAFSNVIRSGIEWIVGRALEYFQEDDHTNPSQMFVSCPAQYEASVVNQLTQLVPGLMVTPTRQVGVGWEQTEAVVAAILGLFHIDQMPANVPWLTGADCQRILGRITPGRPSNWRQLVRVMADFHPAPMKLKDAV